MVALSPIASGDAALCSIAGLASGSLVSVDALCSACGSAIGLGSATLASVGAFSGLIAGVPESVVTNACNLLPAVAGGSTSLASELAGWATGLGSEVSDLTPRLGLKTESLGLVVLGLVAGSLRSRLTLSKVVSRSTCTGVPAFADATSARNSVGLD